MAEENAELLEEQEETQEELDQEELETNEEETEEQEEQEENEESQEDDGVHPDFQGLGEKGKRKAQKRFDKMTAEKYKALEDAAAERAKNRELQERLDAIEKRLGVQDAPAQEETPSSAKPSRHDYEDDDEYFEALADYKAEEKIQKVLKARETKETKNRMQKELTEKQNSQINNFKTKTSECIDKYEDYLDVTATVPISMDSELGQEILDSKELCGEIMYKLGKDPDLRNELSGLSGKALTKAFGRLEASLETKEKAPLKKKKQAPGPANTNRRNTNYTGKPKIQDLSPEEHYRLSCEGKL